MNQYDNKARPLFSVLMPAYNQAGYIGEALDSLLKQTYANWEVAIVDDGSPDNVSEIVRPYISNYPSQIRYYHTDNHGVAHARNYAVEKTSGDLILPLDADDTIESEYIKICVEKLITIPELKVVYCNWNMFGAVNKVFPLSYNCYQDLLISNKIFNSAMYRREDFNRVGGYDTNIPYGFEDWDFWISLLDDDAKVCHIQKALFNYRIKRNSRSADVNLEECQRILVNICSTNIEISI